jgi:hypothetical protein
MSEQGGQGAPALRCVLERMAVSRRHPEARVDWVELSAGPHCGVFTPEGRMLSLGWWPTEAGAWTSAFKELWRTT